MYLSYNLATLAGNSIIKIREYKEKREYVLNEKEWLRVSTYLNKYNYFATTNSADLTSIEIESINISYPKLLRKEMHSKLQNFFKNPNTISAVSSIFLTHIKLDDDGNVYIDGKIETNPSKVGMFFMRKFKENAQKEILVDAKDMIL